MQVRYWSGVIVSDEIRKAYETVFDKLSNGQLKSTSLKKLRGYHVYSIRTNKKGRLLFTIQTVNGENYLIFLEELPNHEYNRAYFLTNSALKKYLKSNEEVIDELTSDPIPSDDPILRIKANFQSMKAASFYGKNFVTLDENQETVKTKSLPLVIFGGSGNGKSLLLQSILESNVDKNIDQPILYMAESRNLVENAEKLWKASPYYQEGRVIFKTYEDLVRDIHPELINPFTMDTFKEIMSEILSAKWKKVDNIEQKVYQEFRILSHYTEKKQEYLALSRNLTVFEEKHREYLFDLYTNFIKKCEARKILHPFHEIDLTNYGLVLGDEFQDYSGNTISSALKNPNIVMAVDSNQNMKDGKTFTHYIISETLKEKYSILTLPLSYRCPPQICDLANLALALKFRLNGGVDGKYEYTSLKSALSDPGIIYKIDPENKEKAYTHIKQLGQSSRFAIVTAAEFKEKAKEIFGTSLVFTPEEIKGLEFETVLCFNLTGRKAYNRFNDNLPKNISAEPINPHKPKNKGYNPYRAYIPLINKIFVSLTRARQATIVLFSEEKNQNQALVDLLSSCNFNSENELLKHIEDEKMLGCNDLDWAELALALYKSESNQQHGIEIVKSKITAETYEKLLQNKEDEKRLSKFFELLAINENSCLNEIVTKLSDTSIQLILQSHAWRKVSLPSLLQDRENGIDIIIEAISYHIKNENINDFPSIIKILCDSLNSQKAIEKISEKICKTITKNMFCDLLHSYDKFPYLKEILTELINKHRDYQNLSLEILCKANPDDKDHILTFLCTIKEFCITLIQQGSVRNLPPKNRDLFQYIFYTQDNNLAYTNSSYNIFALIQKYVPRGHVVNKTFIDIMPLPKQDFGEDAEILLELVKSGSLERRTLASDLITQDPDTILPKIPFNALLIISEYLPTLLGSYIDNEKISFSSGEEKEKLVARNKFSALFTVLKNENYYEMLKSQVKTNPDNKRLGHILKIINLIKTIINSPKKTKDISKLLEEISQTELSIHILIALFLRMENSSFDYFFKPFFENHANYITKNAFTNIINNAQDSQAITLIYAITNHYSSGMLKNTEKENQISRLIKIALETKPDYILEFFSHCNKQNHDEHFSKIDLLNKALVDMRNEKSPAILKIIKIFLTTCVNRNHPNILLVDDLSKIFKKLNMEISDFFQGQDYSLLDEIVEKYDNGWNAFNKFISSKIINQTKIACTNIKTLEASINALINFALSHLDAKNYSMGCLLQALVAFRKTSFKVIPPNTLFKYKDDNFFICMLNYSNNPIRDLRLMKGSFENHLTDLFNKLNKDSFSKLTTVALSEMSLFLSEAKNSPYFCSVVFKLSGKKINSNNLENMGNLFQEIINSEKNPNYFIIFCAYFSKITSLSQTEKGLERSLMERFDLLDAIFSNERGYYFLNIIISHPGTLLNMQKGLCLSLQKYLLERSQSEEGKKIIIKLREDAHQCHGDYSLLNLLYESDIDTKTTLAFQEMIDGCGKDALLILKAYPSPSCYSPKLFTQTEEEEEIEQTRKSMPT